MKNISKLWKLRFNFDNDYYNKPQNTVLFQCNISFTNIAIINAEKNEYTYNMIIFSYLLIYLKIIILVSFFGVILSKYKKYILFSLNYLVLYDK